MIVDTVPAGARSLLPAENIKAVFNPLKGRYEFTSTVNGLVVPYITVDFLELDKVSVYLLESIAISSSITDNQYYGAVVDTPEVELVSKLSGAKMQHFPDTIVAGRVGGQNLFSGWFYSENLDTMQLRVKGSFKQTADLIGVETIDLRVTSTVYRTSGQFAKDIKEHWNG